MFSVGRMYEGPGGVKKVGLINKVDMVCLSPVGYGV